MGRSPCLDGCLEVGDELLDALEPIRRLHPAVVPVIALAALAVEADHPHAADDIGEAILDAVP